MGCGLQSISFEQAIELFRSSGEYSFMVFLSKLEKELCLENISELTKQNTSESTTT